MTKDSRDSDHRTPSYCLGAESQRKQLSQDLSMESHRVLKRITVLLQSPHWFTILLLVGCAVSIVKTGRPLCTTSSGLEGETASVKCHFAEDIPRRHVHVFKYDFNRLRATPEIVAECYWHEGNDSPNCATAEGFQFDSDTATLTIPVSSQHHAGVYKCDYTDQAFSPEYGCELYIRGRTVSCTGSTVHEGETASVTCHFNSDLSITKDEFFVSHIGKEVLTCIWNRDGSHKCVEHPDVTINGTVSRTVTIVFVSAGKRHAGQYQCGIAPTSKRVTLRQCTVVVREKSTTHGLILSTNTSTTLSSTSTAITTTKFNNYFHVSTSKHPHEKEKSTTHGPTLSTNISTTLSSTSAAITTTKFNNYVNVSTNKHPREKADPVENKARSPKTLLLIICFLAACAIFGMVVACLYAHRSRSGSGSPPRVPDAAEASSSSSRTPLTTRSTQRALDNLGSNTSSKLLRAEAQMDSTVPSHDDEARCCVDIETVPAGDKPEWFVGPDKLSVSSPSD